MKNVRRASGFSLVELLVGIVISILASIVMFQVFAISERQKRVTTSAADAQTNGAMALYLLERDLKMTGWGLPVADFKNCNTWFTYIDNGASPPSPVSTSYGAGVVIADGGTNPDTITVQFYSDPDNANYVLPPSVQLIKDMTDPTSVLTVSSTYGCAKNSLAFVKDIWGNCSLMQVSADPSLEPYKSLLQVPHDVMPTPNYNPPLAYATANGWPTYQIGSTFQCLQLPNQLTHTFSVNNEQLQMQEPDAMGITQTFQLAPEIIDLQAQYGIAAAGFQQVTQWVDATGIWTPPLSTAQQMQIKAVRIAVLARSSQYEKPDASGVCTTTTATMAANWSPWAQFNLAHFPADWQCYRYKAFETIVPLRNVIWGNV